MKIKFQKMLQADTGALGGVETQTESGSQTQTQNETVVEQGTEQKSFTQDDIDRIVSKRLDQAQRKWEKQTQTQIEALKVSSMTQEEKENYEKSKYDRMLQEKEELLRVRELKLDAVKILDEKHLSPVLMDFLNYTDESTMKESIDKLQGIIVELANADVTRRMKQGSYTPPGENGTRDSSYNDPFLKGLRGSK